MFYVPNATVIHRPLEERVTRRWSLIRALCHGASNSLLQYLEWGTIVGQSGREAGDSHHEDRGERRVHHDAEVTGRDATNIMSRSGTTCYWAGFTRGALRKRAAALRQKSTWIVGHTDEIGRRRPRRTSVI